MSCNKSVGVGISVLKQSKQGKQKHSDSSGGKSRNV